MDLWGSNLDQTWTLRCKGLSVLFPLESDDHKMIFSVFEFFLGLLKVQKMSQAVSSSKPHPSDLPAVYPNPKLQADRNSHSGLLFYFNTKNSDNYKDL